MRLAAKLLLNLIPLGFGWVMAWWWALWGSLAVFSVAIVVVIVIAVLTRTFRLINILFPASLTRGVFQSMDAVHPTLPHNHSHPECAANRNMLEAIVVLFSALIGAVPYFYQMSSSDYRRNHLGSKKWFWGEDLRVPEQDFAPEPSYVIAMIDTDFYPEEPELAALLSATSAPVIIGTVCVLRAANGNGEYTWKFGPDGTLYSQVKGGRRYVHKLWDWSGDLVTFQHEDVTSVYNIDRKQFGSSPDHVVICLSLMVRYRGTPPRELQLSPLRRLNPVHGEGKEAAVVLRVHGSDGIYVSLAKLGSDTSIELPVSSYDTALAMAELQLGKLSAGMLESAITGLDGKNISANEATRLAGIIKKSTPLSSARMCVPEKPFHRAQPGAVLDPDAEPSAIAFMGNVVKGAVVFDKTPESMGGAIKGRIKDIANDDYLMTGTTIRKMSRFIDLLLEGKDRLRPVSREDVYAKRNRPTQKAVDAREMYAQKGKKGIKAHRKKETYDNFGDSRVISTAGSKNAVDYGTFTHALAPLLRSYDWYTPGMTPVEISERLCDVLAGQDAATMTDFSRMDGRKGAASRLLWQMFVMRAFEQRYAEQLSELLRDHCAQRGKSEAGTHSTGLAQNSGAFDTTDANSLTTGFTLWDGLVTSGVDEREALKRFIVCGDDGVAAGNIKEKVVLSAKMVGMVIECEVTLAGQLGVNFVNRWYGPGVFYGDGNSMCDVWRALYKFHLAVSLPPGATNEDLARDKAFAYLLSDGNTPLFGTYLRTILRCLGAPTKRFGLGPYSVSDDVDVQYPNVFADWMLTYVHRMLPSFDWALFENWAQFADAKNVLSVPCCAERDPAIKRSGWLDMNYVVGKPYEGSYTGANGKEMWGDWDYLHRRFQEKRDEAKVQECAAVADTICAMDEEKIAELITSFDPYLEEEEVDFSKYHVPRAEVQDSPVVRNWAWDGEPSYDEDSGKPRTRPVWDGVPPPNEPVVLPERQFGSGVAKVTPRVPESDKGKEEAEVVVGTILTPDATLPGHVIFTGPMEVAAPPVLVAVPGRVVPYSVRPGRWVVDHRTGESVWVPPQ